MRDIDLLIKRAHRKAALAEAGMLPRTSAKEIASRIDHTFLPQVYVPADIRRVCDEAIDRGFASVCVPLNAVPIARTALEKTSVHVGTVVGFPLGTVPPVVKACEIRWAIEHGAQEIDVVLSLCDIKQDDKEAVTNELRTLRECAGKDVILKAILETPRLAPEEIIRTTRLAALANFDYVKTCTDFFEPATYFDVAMLAVSSPQTLKIKASGGIRSVPQILAFLSLGVDRIGTSRALQILDAKKGLG